MPLARNWKRNDRSIAYLASGCMLCNEAKEGNHGKTAVLNLIDLRMSMPAYSTGWDVCHITQYAAIIEVHCRECFTALWELHYSEGC